MERIFILDPIHEAGVARMAAAHAIVTDPALATIAVVRTSPFGADKIAAIPDLRLIVKHGAGVDNIAMDAASARGILVANTPGGANATAVAEGALTLMLATLRRVTEMDAAVRAGRFDARWGVQLRDLTGARVGLIGFGRIARAVAQICKHGFGCEIAAFDPHVAAEEMEEAGVIALELPELMRCDVVSIHAPLLDSTRGMIGAAELALMHRDAIIVLTSRGGIIDEAALAAALATGGIAGAGIDVFADEPPAPDHPLFALPNAVLAPHVAGVTQGSMKAMALAVADVVDSVLAGERPATLLNPEVWKHPL